MSAAAFHPRADGPIEHGLLVGTVAALLLSLAGCSGKPATTVTADSGGGQKQESADEFVARINRESDVLDKEQAASEFTQKTYIDVDTEYLNARATDRSASRWRDRRRPDRRGRCRGSPQQPSWC